MEVYFGWVGLGGWLWRWVSGGIFWVGGQFLGWVAVGGGIFWVSGVAGVLV